jgi:hypothetical protein
MNAISLRLPDTARIETVLAGHDPLLGRYGSHRRGLPEIRFQPRRVWSDTRSVIRPDGTGVGLRQWMTAKVANDVGNIKALWTA